MVEKSVATEMASEKSLQNTREEKLAQLAEEYDGLVSLGEGRWKLDLEDGLEQWWSRLSLLLGLLVCIFGLNLFVAKDKAPFALWFLICCGLLGIVAVLRAWTDNYYILDLPRGQLLLHRTFFSFRSLRVVADFDDVAGFAVDGRLHTHKSSSWWEYFIVVLRKGAQRLIPLTDRERGRWETYHEVAQGLAHAADVPYFRGEEEHSLQVARSDTGTLQVSFHPESPSEGSFLAICPE